MKFGTALAAATLAASLLVTGSASAHHAPDHADHIDLVADRTGAHGAHADHGGHGARPAPRGADASATPATPATRDFTAAHHKMMRDMDQPYTGDPDADFRIQMIPHHQGAIDMARVALKHAKDPWTRQLAESVIVEQQREIAEMRAWLTRRGIAVPQAENTQAIGSSWVRRHAEDEQPGSLDEARGQSWVPSAGIR